MLVAATIATEDKDFYEHPGFDAGRDHPRPVGELSHRRPAAAHRPSRSSLRAPCCYRRKSAPNGPTHAKREIILAAEITRRYSKDDILELYLNEIYYGNLAYGIEAAAETYFGKTPTS